METTVGQVQDKVHEHLLITYKRNIQSNQTAEASSAWVKSLNFCRLQIPCL